LVDEPFMSSNRQHTFQLPSNGVCEKELSDRMIIEIARTRRKFFAMLFGIRGLVIFYENNTPGFQARFQETEDRKY
jgi:hypothetical protein